jgi:hypothetical protein
MIHHFPKICYNANELLDDCNKISTFIGRLRKQADSRPDYFEPHVYFGDGFEAFVETLITSSPIDQRIGIRDYQPTPAEHDMGVDGVGYGPAGEIHTVQAKARSNPNGILTANRDHISNFVAHSGAKYNAINDNMTIFTTAKDLHQELNEKMYMGKVRTIGINDLRVLVDRNENFWRIFRDEVKYFNKR